MRGPGPRETLVLRSPQSGDSRFASPSVASALNWVWWIRGLMSATFTAIEVETISVGVLSTLVSALLRLSD